MWLRRGVWSDYHRTAFGAVLHRGDLLKPTSEARAIVLCDDLTAWSPLAGKVSGVMNGCPAPEETARMREGSGLGSTRGVGDPSIPYIISPRRTQLLSGTPILRWNEIPGASIYSVQIKGTNTGRIIWSTMTDESGVTYPGEPALESGATYLLIVEADNGASSQDEDVPGLGLTLLNANDAQRVRAAAGRLADLGLTPDAEAFGLAQLYTGYDLTAEAIEILERLVQAGSQSAAVYRTLGDLYRHIGVSLEAEARYSTAVELAEAAGDVEGQAAAQAGLGEMYGKMGNVYHAVRWLERALAGYEVLGDAQRVTELEERLGDLSQ